MARKDLAGIAALAGLGMLMAQRGKKGVKADRDVSDREDSRAVDTGRDLEDDMYSDTGPKKGRGAAGTSETMAPEKFGAPGSSMTVSPSKPGAAAAAAAARPAASPAISAVPKLIDRTPPQGGSGGGRGPTAEELAAYKPPVSSKYPDIRGSVADSERANLRKNIREGSQAVEGVYPEQAIGGPGLRTAQSIAKGMASRFGGKEAAAGASPFLKELPYSGTKQLPNAPTKQITGPSKGDLVARDRAARASGRNEEMLRENARRYGLDPDNMNPAAAQAIRKGLGGDEFSLPLKKGGKVKGYANGGSVGSASRRADGIATKGKTKCKMY
jgi:hypothetical protein